MVNLHANGIKVDSQTVTEDENHEWNYAFEGVEKYDGNEAITYTITEDAVEGYEATVSGYNVTNTLVEEEDPAESESDSNSQSDSDSSSQSETNQNSNSEDHGQSASEP